MRTILKASGHVRRPQRSNESGYVLIIATLLLALGGLMVAQALTKTQSFTRTLYAERKRAANYYKVEDTFTKVKDWFHDYWWLANAYNDEAQAYYFSKWHFYNVFKRTTASVGSNDTGAYGPSGSQTRTIVSSTAVTPTLVKLQGTTNSAMLTSDDLMGSNSLPNLNAPETTNNDTATPTSTFRSAIDFNSVYARVTLLDAVILDTYRDYGDPVGTATGLPHTDYEPIWQLDASLGGAGGTRLISQMRGIAKYDDAVGFYGKAGFITRRNCDSYQSDLGAYSITNKSSSCTVGTKDTQAQIGSANIILGNIYSGGGSVLDPDGGTAGRACTDLTCSQLAYKCTNHSDCDRFFQPLASYSNWNLYCSSHQAAVVVSGATTLSPTENTAAQRCWTSVTVNAGGVLTLNSDKSYFFQTLTLDPGGTIVIAPPAGKKVHLYVSTITGNTINGSRINNTAQPYRFMLHYMGASALTVQTDSVYAGHIIAPNASVTISGDNGDFYGSVATAYTLTATGTNSYLHMDLSGSKTFLKRYQPIFTNFKEYSYSNFTYTVSSSGAETE
ncbi:hypothetical protein JNK13_02310 [bacterium]|nr:hypothetical protein [bacterium]